MLKKCYFIFIIFSICISFIHTFHTAPTALSDPIYPTNTTYISSYYGYRELFGSLNFHNGLDFAAPQGTNIYAILPRNRDIYWVY